MGIGSRPVVYFPTSTAEELLSYAESYAETALEKALTEIMKVLIEESVDAVEPEL